MSKPEDKSKAAPTSIVPPKARTKAAKTAADKESKKKKPGFLAGFMTCILAMILLLAGVAAAFWFDFNGFKTLAVTTLRLNETEFRYLEKRSNDLSTAVAELKENEDLLTRERQDLDKKSRELETLENQLAEQKADLELIHAALSDQKAGLDSLIAIYEGMEPQKAAAVILAADSIGENLQILRNMNQNRLTLILAEMAASDAARILSLLSGGIATGEGSPQ